VEVHWGELLVITFARREGRGEERINKEIWLDGGSRGRLVGVLLRDCPWLVMHGDVTCWFHGYRLAAWRKLYGGFVVVLWKCGRLGFAVKLRESFMVEVGL